MESEYRALPHGGVVMVHHVQGSAEVEWTLVSVKQPCCICGGHQGCRLGLDVHFACCVKTSSEWPLTTGGWVHRVEM
jgi:hypothetical protein